MRGVQIRIAGEWIFLPEDFTIDLEQSNPLFNDQGTFSFPFEIPLEPNRSIIKNIAIPFGDIELQALDHQQAEIWFDGNLFHKGIVEVDDGIEFEDSIPVTFLSERSEFMERIKEMNAKDVPLDREIKLGWVVTKAVYDPPISSTEDTAIGTYDLPDYVMMNFTEFNVKDPYPIKPYCNVRLCASNEEGYYKILDAHRPFSGVCFYVMYLIDCLMKHLQICVQRNDLDTMEDMTHLAFFTTQCHVELSEDEYEIPLSMIRKKDFAGEFFQLTYYYSRLNKVFSTVTKEVIYTEQFTYKGKDVYATNENFPDVSIEDVLQDLQTAFGVRFLYDSRSNQMKIVYIRDILKQQGIELLDVEILACSLQRGKAKNIKVTYGKDDDDSFNYTDFSNVQQYDDYDAILDAGVGTSDKTCKIDKKTGNAYRVKVNKETGKDPSLFEVGGYRDYNTGSTEDEKLTDEQTISFSPVIVNSIFVTRDTDGVYVAGKGKVRPNYGGVPIRSGNVYAVFADVDLKSDTKVKIVTNLPFVKEKPLLIGVERTLTIEALVPEYYDTESSETPPLRTYDAGYTLGIMRGAGNEAGVEIEEDDYDGEGNYKWVQTVGSYAFTSDSCDNYGRFFDYNGTESGGADQSGRFSLKLISEKDGYPIDEQYKGRGLAAKFLSEYLYFMANKKTVILTVRMSVTQILGIDFLKRYKIGDYIGFINKISYTLSMNDLGDVTIELYIL